jgi:hypothetical protein
MTDWKYVVEISVMVETMARLDRSKMLSCQYHPAIRGDALVVIEVLKEEVMELPFKTYSDDRATSDARHGGMQVWKVTDTSSFKGEDQFFEICDEYHLVPTGFTKKDCDLFSPSQVKSLKDRGLL